MLAEIKLVGAQDANHDAQCVNYLWAPGLVVSLLMNLANPGQEIKRRVKVSETSLSSQWPVWLLKPGPGGITSGRFIAFV